MGRSNVEEFLDEQGELFFTFGEREIDRLNRSASSEHIAHNHGNVEEIGKVRQLVESERRADEVLSASITQLSENLRSAVDLPRCLAPESEARLWNVDCTFNI